MSGCRKRFGNINTSLTLSYIRSNNIFQYVVGNRLPNGTYSGAINPVIVYNGIPYGTGIFYGGGAIDKAPLPGFGRVFIGNSDGKASYAAIYLTADKPYTELSGWGFSTALTVSTARSNDPAVRAQIGDPFWFDTPAVGDQGWGPVQGMERWRFVGSGTVKDPVRHQAFDGCDICRPALPLVACWAAFPRRSLVQAARAAISRTSAFIGRNVSSATKMSTSTFRNRLKCLGVQTSS